MTGCGGLRSALMVLLTAALASAAFGAGEEAKGDPATRDWLERWEKSILSSAGQRYCDREMGEEIGWLVSPFLNGFYYGYLATRDTAWLDRLVDWSDAWIRRGVREPDGFIGWPKPGGASTASVPDYYTDNMLGEAMALKPLVLMAGTVRKTPSLKARYGEKVASYLKLSEEMFRKWDQRGCWREVKGGGLWVVPPFGIDRETNRWTEGYARRHTDGFSMPANKQNLIALWMIAMYDVTQKPIYRDRAARWWRLMKARMRPHEENYLVWNYWDPAGPWDMKPDGTPKHWVGVHPNGGYYGVDLEGIVAAYQHRLVFTRADIDRLIATNRDYMWNGQVEGAAFRRIDGGEPDPRWQGSPGVLWSALIPYDPSLKKVFLARHQPDGWGGLSATPHYLASLKKPSAPKR
ncbi:MAG: hypothetical protein IT210_07435 [Armatimonadetes bacterium]|nr:hypothetical protein [Armatimonadota bacterium]